MRLNQFVRRLTALPLSSKAALVAAIDALLAVITMWLAFCLRLSTLDVPWTAEMVAVCLLSPIMAFPIFVRCGLYRAVFRYSGFGATAAIARAVSIYSVVFGSTILLLSLPNVPRTVALIQPMLFAWSVLAVRAFGAALLARDQGARETTGRERLIVYGAGVSGIQTATALRVNRKYQVVGFIDDDSNKAGRHIMGLTVHSRAAATRMLEEKAVDSVLLALPSVSRGQRNAILEWLRPYGLHVRSVPSVIEIAAGKVTLSDLRDLDIEDLLGRGPVPGNFDQVTDEVAGRVVLVTGAGGSIGSELCRQLLQARPAKLLLVESSEFALYTIHNELLGLSHQIHTQVELVPLICDVRNADRVDTIFATWHPATVYHAAAYKHVPLVEHNPFEGVANNVLGTVNVAQAAIANGARRFVLISTDKAVRPTNVMGASKRLAEVVLQAMAAEAHINFRPGEAPTRNDTILTMVRFGNVLGSSGSVVPLFRSQLVAGGPLTVTHEEVTRYFMTIPEAVQLVLQAGTLAKGGEVFLLDMGEPVRIFDLARRIIELSGSRVRDAENPDGDIEIAITGLRPGEKLYEELLIDDNALPTEHGRIMQARERMWPWNMVGKSVAELRAAIASNELLVVRAILALYVDGFSADSDIVDWVELERATANPLPVPVTALL